MPTTRFIIPDASALGAALFTEPFTENAKPLLEAIQLKQFDFLMPLVGISEFLNICRKKLEKDRLSQNIIKAQLTEFLKLSIAWIEFDVDTASKAWELYIDHQIGTNDAFYCLLAKEFEAELWTLDGDLIQNGSAYGIAVHDLRLHPFS